MEAGENLIVVSCATGRRFTLIDAALESRVALCTELEGGQGLKHVGREKWRPQRDSNPFTGACLVELAGTPPGVALAVFDVAGRLRARLPAEAPGRWKLQSGPGLPPGTYVLRVGAFARRVTLLP